MNVSLRRGGALVVDMLSCQHNSYLGIQPPHDQQDWNMNLINLHTYCIMYAPHTVADAETTVCILHALHLV